MLALVGEIDDVGVARIEDDAHDVALGVYEAAGRREILALSGGGIPAGHDALVGVEVEFIVGRAHREGLDGIPYGSEIAVGIEQVVIPLDVSHVRVGVVGDGIEISVSLVPDVGVVPIYIACGQVGAQEDTRYEDAEIVEDFDISGLLVHHVDAVLASVVYAEADVEVVVLVDGDSRFGLRREIRPDQRGGSFGHGSALHAPGDRGNIGLDDVVEQFVELYLVLLVLTHGDRDDALFAREFGGKDEHAVSRRGDYGCAFFVEIDIEGFGVGAEVLALDDYLGRYRPGFRIERFEFDGFVGLVSRIPPPSSPSEHADSPIPAVRQASHKCNRHLQ